jgi:hypothetical protein
VVDKRDIDRALFVLLAVGAGLVAWSWFSTGKPRIDRPAPEIIGKDLDGKPMKLSDFRGKVVMLDFWGDW